MSFCSWVNCFYGHHQHFFFFQFYSFLVIVPFLSPRCILSEDALVSELIEPGTGCWNTSKIDVAFLPYKASTIKAIPLSSRNYIDKLICTSNKQGIYTVKRAYRLLKEHSLLTNTGETFSRQYGQQFWKSLWSLLMPPKVKFFCWRAINEILPTKSKLFHKGILQSFSCDLCQEEPETVIHSLWECSFAKEI